MGKRLLALGAAQLVIATVALAIIGVCLYRFEDPELTVGYGIVLCT